jgi:hypothetical protein
MNANHRKGLAPGSATRSTEVLLRSPTAIPRGVIGAKGLVQSLFPSRAPATSAPYAAIASAVTESYRRRDLGRCHSVDNRSLPLCPPRQQGWNAEPHGYALRTSA